MTRKDHTMKRPRTTGRNEPCPCGSGRKFKRCCLDRYQSALADRPSAQAECATRPNTAGCRFDDSLVAEISQGQHRYIKSFHALEIWAETFWKQYGRQPVTFADTNTAKSMRATPVEMIQRRVSIFQTNSGRRYALLLNDVIHSVNERRLYLAALAVRATIETAAAIVSFESEFTSVVTEGIGSLDEAKRLGTFMDRLTAGGYFDWQRWTRDVGGRKALLNEYADGSKQKVEIPPLRVSKEMIRRLDDRLTSLAPENKGLVRLVYDYLSDICHPSVGGYLFQECVQSSPGWYKITTGVPPELFREFCTIALVPSVQRLSEVSAKALSDLTCIAGSLEECLPNAIRTQT